MFDNRPTAAQLRVMRADAARVRAQNAAREVHPSVIEDIERDAHELGAQPMARAS